MSVPERRARSASPPPPEQTVHKYDVDGFPCYSGDDDVYDK